MSNRRFVSVSNVDHHRAGLCKKDQQVTHTHTDRKQHPRHRHTHTWQEQHSKPPNEHLPQTLNNVSNRRFVSVSNVDHHRVGLCKKINRSHTHTHTDREQHPRHRHTHKWREQHPKPPNEHLPIILNNVSSRRFISVSNVDHHRAGL